MVVSRKFAALLVLVILSANIFALDTIAPVLGMTTNKPVYASGETMLVTVNVSDNVAIGNPAAFDDWLVKIKFSNMGYTSSTYYPFETALNSNVFTKTISLVGVPDGLYGLTAQATDAAGNTGYRNMNFRVNSTVAADTTVPVLGVTLDKPVYASGETMLVTVNVSDNVAIGNPSLPDNALVKVKFSNMDYSSGYIYASETGANTKVFTASLSLFGVPDGIYGLTAQAADAAGNIGYRNVQMYVNSTHAPADTTAPVLGMTINKPVYASGETMLVTVNVSDNVAIGNPAQPDTTLVKVKFSNMGYSSPTYNPPETAPNSLVFITSMSLVGVPDGLYGLTAQATDAAGNTGYRNMNFRVNSTVAADTTPPTISTALDRAVYTNSQSMLINVTATDNVAIGNPAQLDDSLMNVQLSGPNGYMSQVYHAAETAQDSNQFLYSFPLAGLPDGAYMLSAYASDHEGNTGYGDVQFYINSTPAPAADSQAPTVTLINPLEGAVLTATGTLDAKFLAADNVAITSARLLFGMAGGNYTSGYQEAVLGNDGFYHHTFNLATLSPGQYTMLAEAFDAAGNSQIDANVINITGLQPMPPSDTQPPVVKISLDQSSRQQGTTPLTITIWAIDNGAVVDATVKASLIGTGGYTTGFFPATPKPGNTYTIVMDTSLLPAGSYKVLAEAKDNAGNSGADAVTFTVTAAAPQAPPEVPPVVGPNNSNGGSQSQGAEALEAERRLAVLETKINYASSQGADTSAALSSLAKARAYASQEQYSSASTEIDKGEILVDYAMSRTGDDPNLPPPSPYGGYYFPCLPVPGLVFLVFAAAGLGMARKR